MNRSLALVLFLGGLVSMVLGISAMNSFSADVSRFVAGLPTDKAVWMLIGGIVVTVFGLAWTWRSWKHA